MSVNFQECMRVKTNIKKTVELATNEEDQILRFSEFKVFGNGSFKCNVVLKSRCFSYGGDVYFDNGLDFLDAMEQMADELKGEAELKEDYHDHFIKFTMSSLGHVIVSGAFVEYSEHSQNMAFEFKTDQTCLKPFINNLKGAIQ